MNDEKQLDARVSAATDEILAGLQAKDVPPELEAVLQQLCAVIEPNTPIDPTLEHRMRERLSQEWDRIHAQRETPMLRVLRRPAARLVALAAGLMLVIVGVLFALPQPITGAQATASAEPVIALAALLLGLVMVGGSWLLHRR